MICEFFFHFFFVFYFWRPRSLRIWDHNVKRREEGRREVKPSRIRGERHQKILMHDKSFILFHLVFGFWFYYFCLHASFLLLCVWLELIEAEVSDVVCAFWQWEVNAKRSYQPKKKKKEVLSTGVCLLSNNCVAKHGALAWLNWRFLCLNWIFFAQLRNCFN